MALVIRKLFDMYYYLNYEVSGEYINLIIFKMITKQNFYFNTFRYFKIL